MTDEEHGDQGIAEGSIEKNLGNLTPEQLRKYRANRQQFDFDQIAMEEWARAGFVSGHDSGVEYDDND